MSSAGSVKGRTTTPAGDLAGRSRHVVAISGLRVDVVLAGIVLLMLLLGFPRLDRTPAPWFDEGIHLQVAKNLVTNGTYAARSADGTLDYAPSIGVGPTLLLPVAASLEVFGTSLTAGRLVPVVYLVVATALLFAVTRGLFGRRAGFATLALLLTMPALDWVETGRQALGEVPALTFLLAGGLLVYRARSLPALTLAGVVLGLSLVTKGQYVLVVPATLLMLAAVDRRWTRQRSLGWHVTLFVAVLGTWAAWIATLLLLIGDGNIAENVALLHDSSGGALLIFDFGRMAAAWKVVLGPSTFALVVPAALAGLLAIRAADAERRFALLGLWLFQAAWLGWFLTTSIGWPRYAFAGLAINAIFGGFLIDWLIGVAQTSLSRRDRSVRNLAAPVVVIGLAVLLLAGGWRALSPLAREDSHDAELFATVLDVTVPAGVVVDGWEPELGFLSDSAIQAPPPGSLADVVHAQWFGGAMPEFSADIVGEYLVIGPFARWVGVYRDAIDSTAWRRVAVVGQYELYQRVD